MLIRATMVMLWSLALASIPSSAQAPKAPLADRNTTYCEKRALALSGDIEAVQATLVAVAMAMHRQEVSREVGTPEYVFVLKHWIYSTQKVEFRGRLSGALWYGNPLPVMQDASNCVLLAGSREGIDECMAGQGWWLDVDVNKASPCPSAFEGLK